MELRQLRYFIAVAEELSFSRAAKRLRLAQPPLSRQIRQLEEEIGARLFDRSTKHVRLTAAGARFLSDIQPLLRKFEIAKNQARQLAGDGSMGVRIGHIPSLTVGFLPRLLSFLRQKLPGTDITLFEMIHQEQIQALHDGQIDFGFTPSPNVPESFETKPVFSSPVGVLLPDSTKVKSKDGVELASLSDQKFLCISIRRSRTHRDWTLLVCQEAGFCPKIGRTSESLDNLVNLVAAGSGIAILPEVSFQRFVPGVSFRLLREPARSFKVYAVWSRKGRGAGKEILLDLISRAKPSSNLLGEMLTTQK